MPGLEDGIGAGVGEPAANLFVVEGAQALKPAEERLRRSVNPNVYSKNELRSKLREKGSFLQRVIDEPKLFLIGGDQDLGQLAGHRKAEGT